MVVIIGAKQKEKGQVPMKITYITVAASISRYVKAILNLYIK